ncbi:MAG: hypothetical protein H7A35_04375 [Planctomycetales bacterium]|nr:hypothetical protein [bacterium]UNM09293.1 MAG: hypothetical protein H7A35_04375 [Planctomycetales bacterium]
MNKEINYAKVYKHLIIEFADGSNAELKLDLQNCVVVLEINDEITLLKRFRLSFLGCTNVEVVMEGEDEDRQTDLIYRIQESEAEGDLRHFLVEFNSESTVTISCKDFTLSKIGPRRDWKEQVLKFDVDKVNQLTKGLINHKILSEEEADKYAYALLTIEMHCEPLFLVDIPNLIELLSKENLSDAERKDVLGDIRLGLSSIVEQIDDAKLLEV